MSFADVLAAARALTADERRELLRELAEPPPAAVVEETDRETLRQLFPPDRTFEVWSPWDAHEAAATLQQLLEQRSGAK